MWGRFYAVAVAVLLVLPLVLVADTALRPKAAWARVGRSKWRWVAAFAAAPVGSALTSSFVPAVAILPVSFLYLTRVRSVLDVATGLALGAQGRRMLSAQHQAALEPVAVVYPPTLLFWGLILWTGDARERVIASAMALALLSVVGALVWWTWRRAP